MLGSTIRLAVEFTVIGTVHFLYLLIEQRNLVGLQTRLQIAGNDALVECRTLGHHHQQLQRTARNGMFGSDAYKRYLIGVTAFGLHSKLAGKEV